jgi:ATP-dependent DNA helicase RecQ
MNITVKLPPKEVLKIFWGYDDFRLIQKEIIENVLQGNDTFALMQTGGGKSLCFQVPTMMSDGMCIVISPLIALMKDQVDALKSKGITATLVNSQIDKRTINSIYIDCEAGKYKFLYVSPERLRNMAFLRCIVNCNVCLVAIDEAHSISEWGQDFRTAYQDIRKFKKIFPNAPMIALTATATGYVKEEIIKTLGFNNNYKSFESTFKRDNLNIQVIPCEDKILYLKNFLKDRKDQTGIIYSNRRLKCENTAKKLSEQFGIPVEYYHGGLPASQRTTRQENWIKGKAKQIVCTNAFGMGIDKADVRFVIHIDFPKNLESYYQEIGRGGRDGKESDCIFLYSSSDIKDHIQYELKYPDFEQIKDAYYWLRGKFQKEISKNHFFVFSIENAADGMDIENERALRALRILEVYGYISLQSSSSHNLMVSIQKDKDFIKSQGRLDNKFHVLMFHLFRLMKGQKKIGGNTKIDFTKWKTATKFSIEEFDSVLKGACNIGAIKVQQQDDEFLGKIIKFIEPSKFNLKMDEITQRKEFLETQQDLLMSYVVNDRDCRVNNILSYFGEQDADDCGKCDVCLSKSN